MSEPDAPPISEPSVVPEYERPVPRVTEVVATPYTPAPPFDTRRFDDKGCEVVARPDHPRDAPEPMAVKEPVKGAASVGEDVPTAYMPLVPFETKRLPFENVVEVARPLHEIAPLE